MFIRNIIYFSHCLGQQKTGVDQTPSLLYPFVSKNKNNYLIENTGFFFDNLKNLYTQNDKLDDIKLNIGGDHSMAISTVANSLNKYPDLKVIWFDAHPDINTYEKSISKNYHGMPLAFLTGLDYNQKFNFINNHLSFENLLYIGIRDIDEFEQEIIEKYQIKYISCDQFNNNYEESKKIIQDFINGSKIHISFDVDSLDPLYIPSTGTRFLNGLELESTKNILDYIFQLHNNRKTEICNIDLTELNFEIGNKLDNFKSLANILYLFNKVIY